MASLRDIAIGSSAEVALVAGGDPTAERLLEMGITPGVRVRVVGAAPLGCPVELEVRGYRLSLRRAEAVKKFLVSKGVETNRIYTEGKGESSPAADNRTREGRAKNRRVEVEVVGTRTLK